LAIGVTPLTLGPDPLGNVTIEGVLQLGLRLEVVWIIGEFLRIAVVLVVFGHTRA